jgi:hypothetical protein
MRSAILMGSVAAIALATPALALPDRYEQGYSCTGQGALCTQEQMRLDDGNRASERGIDQSTADRSQADASSDSGEFGDSAENTADEAGDEINEAADEAGDEIGNTADEAGDELDEAGDEIGDAFD